MVSGAGAWKQSMGGSWTSGNRRQRGMKAGWLWELPRCTVSPQVSELPFPFERHQQFEQSIRMPVGPTWNTQRAFQKLTAPRVITRAGHIIQPISAEDVPDMATAAGTGAKPALEIVPKQQERPFRRPPKRAR